MLDVAEQKLKFRRNIEPIGDRAVVIRPPTKARASSTRKVAMVLSASLDA